MYIFEISYFTLILNITVGINDEDHVYNSGNIINIIDDQDSVC